MPETTPERREPGWGDRSYAWSNKWFKRGLRTTVAVLGIGALAYGGYIAYRIVGGKDGIDYYVSRAERSLAKRTGKEAAKDLETERKNIMELGSPENLLRYE